MKTSSCILTGVFGLLVIHGAAFGQLPLGLTIVNSESGARAKLSVYDGTAYVATTDAVWTIESDSNVMRVPVLHPETMAIPDRLTRVVQGTDGEIYVGAVFEREATSYYDPQSAWLFRLDDLPTPVANWGIDDETGLGPDIVGFDRNLRGVGQLAEFSGESEWITSEFFIDGSVHHFDVPDDPILNQSLGALITSSSENGFAVGDAGVPGTAGVTGAM